MATVNFTKSVAGDERIPVAVYDPERVSLLRSGSLTAWWQATGMLEGLASGSLLPTRWKHLLDTQKFPNSFTLAGASKPILGYDPQSGRNYLQFGYGGLSRRSLRLAGLFTVSSGSGYTAGDTVTLSNGVVVTYTGSTGSFSNDSNFTITDYGSFSSQPTGVLAQISTSGGGSGATFLPEMATDCGSMQLTPTAQMIPNGSFSIIAVFRCPDPAQVPDSGGFIFGAQLNESEVYSTSNTRYWGLRVGNKSAGEGVLNFHDGGDGKRTSVSGDVRDGMWHVAVGCMPAVGSNPRLWLDGALNDNRVGGTFSGLNATTGSRYIRVGAAGKPASGPTGGFCGDIAELLIVPSDLNADAGLRKQIVQELLDTYRPGLTAG